MSEYRKKLVVIEAVKYDGRNGDAISAFIGDDSRASDFYGIDGEIAITTLEGTMLASVGDWIIRGVAGEFYPCKPDIFEATYEPVDEVAAVT